MPFLERRLGYGTVGEFLIWMAVIFVPLAVFGLLAVWSGGVVQTPERPDFFQTALGAGR